jgi:tetratricopeptide (TPR) repeat protein
VISRIGLLFCLLLPIAPPALADAVSLAQAWDEVTYQRDPAAREDALKSLTERAHTELAAKPDDPSLLIWYGIIVSSYAGEKGGLGALGLAKDSRASLERSIALDPIALNGSAYTSLGALYYKVPGWPIGFGSSKTAREYLAKALDINPTGIDSNYFMGDFLFAQGEYANAKSYLTTALNAPDRPGRRVGDEGRRNEIRALLAMVDRKLDVKPHS